MESMFLNDIVLLESILDGSSDPQELSLPFLKYITDNFSENNVIGSGGFGAVYKGEFKNKNVAVKKLTFSTKGEKYFIREIDGLMRVNHKNVVKCLGYCNETKGTLVNAAKPGEQRSFLYTPDRVICFEYISNGNLTSHLHDELRGHEWHTRYNILKEICQGLHYIHSQKLVHRDLKPDNILLDNLMVPKIADFGICKLLEDGATHAMTTSADATWDYAAPEFKDQKFKDPEFKDRKVSVKYDMYSLGLIIIELVTGFKQDPDLKTVLRRWRYRWNKSNETLRYQQVVKCVKIGISCQHKTPKKRPSISKIIKDLEDVDGGNGAVGQVIPCWNDLLWVEPPELFFPFQINKKISRLLELHNQADAYMAFFIKTYSDVLYEIDPIEGIIQPRSHLSVSVTLIAQEEWPEKKWNTDEFIIKSKKLNEVLTAEEITKEMFSKKSGHVVDRIRIGVVFDAHERAPCCISEEPKEHLSGETSSMAKSSVLSVHELDKKKAQAGWYTLTAPMNIPYLLLKKITSHFSEDRIIGRGRFGDVYKGQLDNGELIAIKMLHPLQGLADIQFQHEVCNNLVEVDHPNIIGPLGYCDEIHSKFVEYKGEKVSAKYVYRGLCFEYFPSGSLQKQLDEQSLAPNWSTRYNIIKGICEGLNFLHECEPPIFHLDLKPTNILLDISMVPKLGDFGLSRLFAAHTHATQRTIGKDKYMPPEYKTGGIISAQNDVFSFGVVIIEIMEGYSLFQEIDDVTQFRQEVLTKWSSMIEPTSKYRFVQLRQVETCIDTAIHCVDSIGKNRPTIANILHVLNETETGIPSAQLAVVPLSKTIELKNSLGTTLKMMTDELDNIKSSVPNIDQMPEISEASSNVEVKMITRRSEDRETSLVVEEELIIGRTEDKRKILSILSESSTNEMVILPIYGIGGIGKTTLAQLVFNDTQFQGYSRVWVYVSEKLDFNKIGNSIISQLTNVDTHIDDMQMVHNHLGELLAGKSILIVLDNLWEDKPGELDKLKGMLSLGKGKKVIIVTTRDKSIARKICGTVNNVPYKLKNLTDDMCWCIIKQKSDFENQPSQKHLEYIGRNIAIKCGGVALAAQSLGYLLRDMSPDQWESVRDSYIWNISTSEDPLLTTHEVLASLRLIYSHMHSFLQLCFSYCAVFPKGQMIKKNDLIHQWIALEFTEPSRIFDSMQLCERYCRHLLDMSFLQYSLAPLVEVRQDKDATFFTMHDLVHDLARAMLADKVNKNGNVSSSCMYALLTDPSKPLQSIMSSPENMKALHFLDCAKVDLHDGAISAAKFLIVLDLSGCFIQKLPDSIGQLKQLRYLNAPRIQDWMTPNCIGELSKLNYLSLRGSSNIKELPDSIGDMKGLMHLDLSGCQSIGELPLSFIELKQLVHLDLSYCPVSVSEFLGGFTKLQYLNLALALEQGRKHMKRLPEVISNLIKLRYLNLSRCMQGMAPSETLLGYVSTLSNLEHLNLADNWELDSLPESIANLTMLHTLDFSGCNKIRGLPEWIYTMVSLKVLVLDRFDAGDK